MAERKLSRYSWARLGTVAAREVRECFIIGAGNAGLKQKLITALVGITIAAMIAIFAVPSYREGEPSLHGRLPKNFAFTVDGKAQHLSDLRGHLVVLNFWASWCPPCVEEAPSLNALQQRIAGMGGIVLGVDPDVNGEDPAAYQKFLKDYQIAYPTYLDTSQQIAASYGTVVYPETYIISPDGKIDRKIIGPQDWSSPEIVAYLDGLMGQKQAAQESSLVP
jgi:cytochrome c biogenesis protein CcmG, thiol:disulfide interchange protein DsbE